METRTALVTGGAGFMGSWLVDELLKRGHQVVSADNLLGGSERNVNRDCKFVKADMKIRDRVKEVVKGVEIIFHLAAYAAEGQSFFSPVAINEINIAPMNNLLVEAINNGVESFVLDDLSSSRVASVRRHMANPKFKLLEGSVLDQRKIDDAVAGADEAAHMVAVVSVNRSLEDPNLVHRTNVERTLNVLESCQRHSVKRMTFASTATVYGNHLSKHLSSVKI